MKENTPEQEKNNDLCSKKKFDWERASHIATVFSSFSVIVAIVTLLISMYPQLIWRNTNHFEKANAGNVYSQLFLADHYYEIGEYGESIYWYKIASTSEKSNYSYVACNNLGYLYANGYGISDNFSEEFYRFEKALLLFDKAAKYFEAPRNNIRILLKTSSKENFPNISENRYDSLLAQYEVDNLVESVSYEYCDISYGTIFWKGNKKYVGGQYVVNSDGVGQYFYRVYTYAENTDVDVSSEKYTYINFDEIIMK